MNTVAVDRLPNFTADPYRPGDLCPPWHRGSIHLNCENVKGIHEAYTDASLGSWSRRLAPGLTCLVIWQLPANDLGHFIFDMVTRF